jgi:hypothetical protein
MGLSKPELYFACSIRGGRENAETYGALVDHINLHATVLTEIFADNTLTPDGMNDTSSNIYRKDMVWISQAKAMIAEVSSPSLGVGYEIAKAEALGKPVLALFRSVNGSKLSAMIDGSPYIEVAEYSTYEEAYAAINKFLDRLKQ